MSRVRRVQAGSGGFEKIFHVGTYPPRECGIATFTKDLTDALDRKFNPKVKAKIAAINDNIHFYNYGKKVSFQISQANISDYTEIAKKINQDPRVQLVHLQHEYGIFGGNDGQFIVPFLQTLKKPKITTLHTVIPRLNSHMRHTLSDITENSTALIVMSEKSAKILEEKYNVNRSKIHVIPHGIPQVPYESLLSAKRKLGLAGKVVLSTFGMLNPNKGIEYAISALPGVVKKFPNLVYLVIGATHPIVRENVGEKYRNFLRKKIEELKLENFVKFYNKYISLNEIIDYLQATDIYISPALDKYQTVSGTLSYALGCGRPVIATESAYAKEIVSANTGILVEFNNSSTIANAIIRLLSRPKLLTEMSQTAYARTRHMTWANVASSHFEVYKRYANLEAEEVKFPKIKLKHLRRMTDDFGIWQFAKFIKPDKRYGYTLDDNARALIVSCMYYKHKPKDYVFDLIRTYLNFVDFCKSKDGKFLNFINSQKELSNYPTSEDSIGRAIWALGFCASCKSLPRDLRKKAAQLFLKGQDLSMKVESLRARSFIASGIYYYYQSHKKQKYIQIIKKFADHQIKLYHTISSGKWRWFEDKLTYSNSKLIDTLFYAYLLTNSHKYLDIAQKALKFLKEVTLSSEYYSPIGQNGWYVRGGKRSYFDQQPEDTASMIETLLLAFRITKNKVYWEDAFNVYQWFLGKNYLRQMIYDEVTGGCFDGLGKFSVNLNQGAESTISYLLAGLSFEE